MKFYSICIMVLFSTGMLAAQEMTMADYVGRENFIATFPSNPEAERLFWEIYSQRDGRFPTREGLIVTVLQDYPESTYASELLYTNLVASRLAIQAGTHVHGVTGLGANLESGQHRSTVLNFVNKMVENVQELVLLRTVYRDSDGVRRVYYAGIYLLLWPDEMLGRVYEPTPDVSTDLTIESELTLTNDELTDILLDSILSD